MQLTFSCPSCGKPFGLPWSMAGKRARCNRCGNEFVIPAPYEATKPKSSQAIPVAHDPEPTPSPSVARTVRIEALPPAPPPSTMRIEALPPAPQSVESVAPPWPYHVAGWNPAPPPSRAVPPARPAWLIPAIVGGGVALVLTINLGFYLAFVNGRKVDSRPEPEPIVNRPVAVAPVGAVTRPPLVEASPTTPVVPVVAIRPAEEVVSDRVMNTAEIVARYEPSVALIKGKKGSGTGFVARSGIIATNAHVISGERVRDIEVRFPSAPESQRGPYSARLLYQDKDRDLALLGVATDLAPVRLADAYKFRKGEDVTVIGNPGIGGRLILENAISRGIVSSQTKIDRHEFLQLGIAINPGNSGGPVFDPKGRVIGVVTLKTTQQEGLAFAVPAEDLIKALGTAEAAAASGITDPQTTGPILAYAFQPGRTYVYALDLSIDTGNGKVTISGTSTYRIKGVDADGITIAHNGSLTTTKRGKDGKVLPGGANGPESTKEVELKIDDRGYVLAANGSSPLPLLGDFAMLMIEPLPDDSSTTWDDSQTITLREVEPVPGTNVGTRLGRPGLDSMPRGPQTRPGSRARPGSRIPSRPPTPQPAQPQVRVTLHEAKEETKYTLGAQVGDRIPIRKVYELATTERVGRDPRLSMTGDGTIVFDVKAGVPVLMNYKVVVVESTGNSSSRIPITVSCKLLEGRGR